MNKKKANYYLYRVYRLLDSDKIQIILKKINKNRGITDYRTIWLNPHEHILPTLIHECLHIFYPDWCETKVLKYESQIFHKLTAKQINNLLMRLAVAVNTTHEVP